MAATLDSIQPVLMARDIEASVRFYGRLGFQLIVQDDAAEPRYAAVQRDGVEIHFQWHDDSQWAAGIDRPTYRFVGVSVRLSTRRLRGCPPRRRRSRTSRHATPKNEKTAPNPFAHRKGADRAKGSSAEVGTLCLWGVRCPPLLRPLDSRQGAAYEEDCPPGVAPIHRAAGTVDALRFAEALADLVRWR